MKLIKLTKGKFAMVDDEDYENLNQFKWMAFKPRHVWYAVRTSKYINKDKKRTRILLHREIMGGRLGDKKVIDHKDGNGLNCQRNNLRFCTYSENNSNRKAYGTSQYKGVYFYKPNGKWKSQGFINGKKCHFGYFNTEKEAALEYNKRAEELHGEFARLNVIN